MTNETLLGRSIITEIKNSLSTLKNTHFSLSDADRILIFFSKFSIGGETLLTTEGEFAKIALELLSA